jgi:hypothetical protein
MRVPQWSEDQSPSKPKMPNAQDVQDTSVVLVLVLVKSQHVGRRKCDCAIVSGPRVPPGDFCSTPGVPSGDFCTVPGPHVGPVKSWPNGNRKSNVDCGSK